MYSSFCFTNYIAITGTVYGLVFTQKTFSNYSYSSCNHNHASIDRNHYYFSFICINYISLVKDTAICYSISRYYKNPTLLSLRVHFTISGIICIYVVFYTSFLFAQYIAITGTILFENFNTTRHCITPFYLFY